MRLTLRTMLAWLDEVLDPADSQALGQKIEANDFASNLVRRIRGVISKLRLGAPKPVGKGMGRDANSVAEYLDSRLADEKVAEFEKTCLESDILLAETACCHQILSRVLHKPADVSPSLRDRIYALDPSQVAAPPVSTTAPAANVNVGSNGVHHPPVESPPVAQQSPRSAPAPEPVTPKPANVPDYMKAGSGFSFWPYLGVAALVFGLAFAALRAMGPFDHEHPLAVLVQASKPEEVAQADGADSEIDIAPDLTDTTEFVPDFSDGGELTEVDPDSVGINTGAPVTAFDKTDGGEVIEGDDAGPPPVVIEGDTGPPPVVTEGDTGPPPVVVEGDAGPPDSGEPTITEEGPPGGDPIEPKEPGSGTVEPVDPAPEVVEPGLPEEGAVARGGKVIGRSLPGDEVLAFYNPDKSEWLRLPKAGPIFSGRPLLVLPGFRPQITLDIGLRITLLGDTDLRFVTLEDDAEPPACEMLQGRMFITAGKAGVKLPFSFSDRYGFVKLPDADSRLAVQVSRFRAAGASSTPKNIVVTAQIIALSGRVAWQDETREITLNPGEAVTISSETGFAEDGVIELPEWITSPEVMTIDRKAAAVLEPELAENRSLLLSLLEQIDHRRIEVRSLSVRSLAALSYFEPLLQTFNSDEFRAFWNVHFDSASDALTRGAETSELLRKAVERVHVDDTADVFHMLVGYTPSQVETGGDITLVNFLGSDRLDLRVLALENLRRITNMTQGFRPEVSEASRRTSFTRWQNLLDEKKVRYPEAEAAKAPEGL